MIGTVTGENELKREKLIIEQWHKVSEILRIKKSLNVHADQFLQCFLSANKEFLMLEIMMNMLLNLLHIKF